MAGKVKDRICAELRAAIKAMPDLSAVTMRMIKESLAPKFGEDWEAIAAEHKSFIKEQATVLIGEAQKRHEKGRSAEEGEEKKPKVSKEDSRKDEAKRTPSTIKKHKVSKAESRNKSKNDISSDDESDNSLSSDDFKEKKKSAKRASKETNPKSQKVKKDEQDQPSSANSKEVAHLKSVAKQCG